MQGCKAPIVLEKITQKATKTKCSTQNNPLKNKTSRTYYSRKAPRPSNHQKQPLKKHQNKNTSKIYARLAFHWCRKNFKESRDIFNLLEIIVVSSNLALFYPHALRTVSSSSGWLMCDLRGPREHAGTVMWRRVERVWKGTTTRAGWAQFLFIFWPLDRGRFL